MRPLDFIAHPDAASAQDAAVLVQHEPLVGGIDRQLGVQRRQLEMGEAHLPGLVLQLAMLVGDAHGTDMVALDEKSSIILRR